MLTPAYPVPATVIVKGVIEFKLCSTFYVIVVSPALALTPSVTAKPTRLSRR